MCSWSNRYPAILLKITHIGSFLTQHFLGSGIWFIIETEGSRPNQSRQKAHFSVPLGGQIKKHRICIKLLSSADYNEKKNYVCGIGKVLWHVSTGRKTFTEQGASKCNPTWSDFNLQNGWSSCCSTRFSVRVCHLRV